MDCERVRDQFLTLLARSERGEPPEAASRHVAGCESCRAELEAMRRTWALLGSWPEARPSELVRARLLRSARRRLLRESVLTLRAWTAPALASAVGVALSLALSLLVPYAKLASACRQALGVPEPHVAPYLLAGIAYGLPLALGAWALSRRVSGGALIGGIEASLLFLVILTPYVVVQCREFPPALQLAFVSGLAGGAIVSSLAALGLARGALFSRSQPLTGGF